MAQENIQQTTNKHNSMPQEVLRALANAGRSKFKKFVDGQTMRLHFYPELTTTIETTFNGMRDKPVRRFKFMVTNHDIADDVPLDRQEAQEWSTGSEVAKDLNDYFSQGIVDLQVTRKGFDKSTKYRINPMQQANR